MGSGLDNDMDGDEDLLNVAAVAFGPSHVGFEFFGDEFFARETGLFAFTDEGTKGDEGDKSFDC